MRLLTVYGSDEACLHDGDMPLLLAARAATISPLSLVASAQGRMLGIPVTSRSWFRVRRGVYVERASFLALPPWEKYAVRVHAFILTHPDAVLCLESAAALHGLPLFGETRDIHVFGDERSSSRRFGDVCVHTSDDQRDILLVQGTLVTSILDTVVDLARVLPPAQALALADTALSPAQGGPLQLNELRAHADAQANRRGRARLEWTWSRADGRSESPAESVSRAVIEWSGFEKPELQQSFRYEGAYDRTDFYFASCRAIGEADGWQKYRLNEPNTGAVQLTKEKRREDRLRRHGHPFARWDLNDARRVAPLCRALSSAGVPLVSAPQHAMLASLSRRPREVA